MSFRIKPAKLYALGSKYYMYRDRVSYDKHRLMAILDGIQGAWRSGGDRDIFIKNYEEHVKSLLEIIFFLEEQSGILKSNALAHSDNDNKFATKMKRSDING